GVLVFVFFFQAEDGIRDDLVTGVQTCALPICKLTRRVRRCRRNARRVCLRVSTLLVLRVFDTTTCWSCPWVFQSAAAQGRAFGEIGRASCRARAGAAGGGGSLRITGAGWRQ